MNIQLPILGLSLLALGSLAPAQVGATPKPAPAPAPAPVRAVVQANVRLHALGNVLGLEIKTQDNKDLGKVEDLVLDSADGSIDYVVIGQGGVLGVGEDKYLVPFESIQFGRKDSANDAELLVTTVLTEERVKKAPRLVKDQRIGPDVERAIREAAGLTPVPMQPRAENSELVGAKRVKGAQVLGATQEVIGEFDDVIVDPHVGVVAYNVLATGSTSALGGKRYALPWEVTHLRVKADGKLEFTSDLTKEQLARAPEIDAKDPKRMLGSAFVIEVFAYFTLEPYFSRSAPASAPRVPPPDEKPKDRK